jgi:hypothetical protein
LPDMKKHTLCYDGRKHTSVNKRRLAAQSCICSRKMTHGQPNTMTAHHTSMHMIADAACAAINTLGDKGSSLPHFFTLWPVCGPQIAAD